VTQEEASGAEIRDDILEESTETGRKHLVASGFPLKWFETQGYMSFCGGLTWRNKIGPLASATSQIVASSGQKTPLSKHDPSGLPNKKTRVSENMVPKDPTVSHDVCSIISLSN
jgi:hypothetical protein